MVVPMSTKQNDTVPVLDEERAGEPMRRRDAVRNHESIVEGAIRVLADRPQASMREVADACGMGRTTVYRHFPTRDVLLSAIFDRVEADARNAMQQAAEADGGAEPVLRRLAIGLVALADRYRFLEHHRDERAERDERRRLERPNRDAGPFARWFGEAQERGELRSDMPVSFMLALVRGSSTAVIDEVLAGRCDARKAGRLLGDAFVGAFMPS